MREIWCGCRILNRAVCATAAMTPVAANISAAMPFERVQMKKPSVAATAKTAAMNGLPMTR